MITWIKESRYLAGFFLRKSVKALVSQSQFQSVREYAYFYVLTNLQQKIIMKSLEKDSRS